MRPKKTPSEGLVSNGASTLGPIEITALMREAPRRNSTAGLSLIVCLEPGSETD